MRTYSSQQAKAKQKAGIIVFSLTNPKEPTTFEGEKNREKRGETMSGYLKRSQGYKTYRDTQIGWANV